MTATYRDFVQPAHPLVRDFFGAAVEQMDALDAALVVLRRRGSYVPAAGHRTFDELRTRYHEAADSRVPLNCLALSSLLVSRLRAAGVPSDEVFVVIGMRRDYPPNAGRLDLHAWTVLRTGTGLRWIDPATLAVEQAAGAAWLDRHHVHVLFNDERIVSFPSEMRRLLARPERDRFRLYAFGVVGAEARAAVQHPGVREGLRSFFTAGSPFEADDEAARLANAAGLITREPAPGAPGPRLVLVSRRQSRDLRAGMDRALERYLAITTETVAQLQVAYESCTAARRFSWREAEHAITAGLFLDLAVGQRLGLAAQLQREQRAHVVWAFEHIESENGYGVILAEHVGRRAGVVELWHCGVRRTPLRLSERGVALLCEAAERSPAAAPMPVFTAGDTRRLIEVLDAGADRLVTEALDPILDLAFALASWRPLHARSSLRQAVARLVLEYGIDRVVDAGVLTPFPAGDAVPVHWGRWVWQEPVASPPLMPWSARAAAEPAAVAS